MCLILEERQEKKLAKRDIYVFKELFKTKYGYRTPYQNTIVKNNVLESDFLGEVQDFSVTPARNTFIVEHGIHTYKFNAHYILRYLMEKFDSWHKRLYLAKIPKGTYYYESYDEICSERIKFVFLKPKQ